VRGGERYHKLGIENTQHAFVGHRDRELELGKDRRHDPDADPGLGRAQALPHVPQRLDEGLPQRHRDR